MQKPTQEPQLPKVNPYSAVILIPTCLVALVLAGVVLNPIRRALLEKCSAGDDTLQAWVWAVVVIAFFVGSTFVLREAVLNASRRSNTVQYVMLVAVGWWCLTFVYEICYLRRSTWKDKQQFTSEDFYSDLTKPMGKVAVVFTLQASLMLILVFVAQQRTVQGVEAVGNVYLVMAIILSIYLFMNMRSGGTWESMLLLRDIQAFEYTSDGKAKVVRVPSGDYSVRLAMCVLTSGIFNRFLVLAYPLFIFGTESFIDLVKDAFAITFVQELANLAGPVTFLTLIESAQSRLQMAEASRQAGEAPEVEMSKEG